MSIYYITMNHIFRIALVMTSCVSAFSYNALVPQLIPSKKTVYFFPASLKKSVPHELYHTFLDNLNTNYDVRFANEMTSDEIAQEINQTSVTSVLLLSHSSGANNLMNTYEKLPTYIPKKAILIDPLDFQKYSYSFSVASLVPGMPTIPRKFEINLDEMDDKMKEVLEKDYIGEWKKSLFNQEPDDCEVSENQILLLNHKKSREWRLFPVIPPIDFLKMDFKRLLENTTIIQKEIDHYSHFDILDRPWANAMNRFVMNKQPKDTIFETETYYKTIMPNIEEFYNNA
jgi:hypothetical protein